MRGRMSETETNGTTMKEYLLVAVAAALAVAGSISAAGAQAGSDTKPADAKVDFSFALQCDGVQSWPGKRIMLPYQEARAAVRSHDAEWGDEWLKEHGILAAYDDVLVAYNHGTPDPLSDGAITAGTQVIEVTPSTISVGGSAGLMGYKSGWFNRRTGYGEIYYQYQDRRRFLWRTSFVQNSSCVEELQR
jgi:hypothetical protein